MIKKILGIFLVPIFLYSTQSLASTVYYQFRHVPAVTANEPGLGKVSLRIRALTTGHDIASKELPLGDFYQDHMSGPWIVGSQQLIFQCTSQSVSGAVSTMVVADFYVIDDAVREVDINASCPVDTQGNLLPPSDIRIFQKK